MTESLKLEATARADLAKEQQRVKEEQEWRISATVDDWMKNEGTVENALLEAVKEVSGDMALLIAEVGKSNRLESYYLYKAMTLLTTQIRKQMREQVEEKLYG
jgi:hypothetical protein